MASAVDNGDPTSPYGDIHPRDKQLIGYRLAQSALFITYHQLVQFLGPTTLSMEVNVSSC